MARTVFCTERLKALAELKLTDSIRQLIPIIDYTFAEKKLALRFIKLIGLLMTSILLVIPLITRKLFITTSTEQKTVL